jgi:hypothetical protein
VIPQSSQANVEADSKRSSRPEHRRTVRTHFIGWLHCGQAGIAAAEWK